MSLLSLLYTLMPDNAGIDTLLLFGGLILTLVGLFTSKGKTKQILVSQSVEQTESTQVQQIRCKGCNSLIPENEKYCGQCGYNMSEIKKPKIGLKHLGYLGLVIIYSSLFGVVAQNAKIGILTLIFTIISMLGCILFIIFVLFFHALE